VEGVVVDLSAWWIRVAVPEALGGGIRGGPWRIDLFANTTAHERCACCRHEPVAMPTWRLPAPNQLHA